ncbi:hypothetical protein ABEB36_012796 [Hypothenemus hampei]|uniref:THAP-type domain-containing protein n=1 Tax=Hypothenemus hampei TaxID=57062 RepID=A0ABD1E7Y6_HYPHA
MKCAVYGCVSDNQSENFTVGTKFVGFPKEKHLQSVWKNLCKRKDNFSVKYARICSKHFSESDYKRNLKHELLGYVPDKYRPLKKNAVPSITLPLKSIENSVSNERTIRQEKRNRQALVKDILNR